MQQAQRACAGGLARHSARLLRALSSCRSGSKFAWPAVCAARPLRVQRFGRLKHQAVAGEATDAGSRPQAPDRRSCAAPGECWLSRARTFLPAGTPLCQASRARQRQRLQLRAGRPGQGSPACLLHACSPSTLVPCRRARAAWQPCRQARRSGWAGPACAGCTPGRCCALQSPRSRPPSPHSARSTTTAWLTR